MNADPIFEPLVLGPHLTLKNRVLRSSVSGRFDNEDGSLTQTRINWETKFARAGVGAIISSFVPVQMAGRILPGFASIDCDDRIGAWSTLIRSVHVHDCKFIMQLSHSGRQRDIPGVRNGRSMALSATSRREPMHGFRCKAMTGDEIADAIGAFAAAARRAQMAGADGVELHACHGYLFSQFLSSAINDRKDRFGGSLENRARFLLDVIRAIRREVGPRFHLQAKISAADYNNVDPAHRRGNTLDETLRVAAWCEAAGLDALHVSTGSLFPHPLMPAGALPLETLADTYGAMIGSGGSTLRNYLAFNCKPLHPIIRFFWHRLARNRPVEGGNLQEAVAIKRAVSIPVLVTGGWQSATSVRTALSGPDAVDGVTIARALVANSDLLHQWARGDDLPPRPCTYCNKCLAHVVRDPIGCYDETRFPTYEAMIEAIMAVYQPMPRLVVPEAIERAAAE